jgi:hypothetical protein
LDFLFWILDWILDFGFWIGIIGVNLIFKPIINLKSDARILLSHPLLPGGGGPAGDPGKENTLDERNNAPCPMPHAPCPISDS